MKNPLDTWEGLNEVIRGADEDLCVKLLKEELKGKLRRQFVLRIHSRMNRMRAARERRELLKLGSMAVKLKWLK